MDTTLLGRKITAQMEERHITQKALCSVTGISRSTLYRLQYAKAKRINYDTLEKLAQVLNVSTEFLVNP